MNLIDAFDHGKDVSNYYMKNLSHYFDILDESLFSFDTTSFIHDNNIVFKRLYDNFVVIYSDKKPVSCISNKYAAYMTVNIPVSENHKIIDQKLYDKLQESINSMVKKSFENNEFYIQSMSNFSSPTEVVGKNLIYKDENNQLHLIDEYTYDRTIMLLTIKFNNQTLDVQSKSVYQVVGDSYELAKSIVEKQNEI